MSHRLTRIYTRSGDDGTTALGDGTRLAKDENRIEVLGCLDELNSHLGLVATQAPAALAELVCEIQHQLFELGGEIAVPGMERIGTADVTGLEQHIDTLNATLPPLREFILPGGGPASAQCHLARAVCRRAERRMVQLGRSERLNANGLRFLNRLSDLLFVLARELARQTGHEETLWQRRETN